MNVRSFILLGKWLGGVAVYVVLSLVISLSFVLCIMRWKYGNDDSPGLGILMFLVFVPVFITCMFWGIIYASALAKPIKFGSTWRVWRHFGLSHILGLLTFTVLWGFLGSRLPDFKSESVTSAYIFTLLALPIICFVLAILVRINLSFRKPELSHSYIQTCAERTHSEG